MMYLKAGFLLTVFFAWACAFSSKKKSLTGLEKELSLCQTVNPGNHQFPVRFCESEQFYYIFSSELPWLELDKKNYQKHIRFYVLNFFRESGIDPEELDLREISLWIRTRVFAPWKPELLAVAGNYIFCLGQIPNLRSPEASGVFLIRTSGTSALSFPQYLGTRTDQLVIEVRHPDLFDEFKQLLRSRFPNARIFRPEIKTSRIVIGVLPLMARSTGMAILKEPSLISLIKTVYYVNAPVFTADYRMVTTIRF